MVAPKLFLFLIAELAIAITIHAQNPVDRQATAETVNLFQFLKKLPSKGFLFGHQDDLAYGVGWKYVPERSDIKDVTGDYPALYGFELGRIEVDQPVNLDSVPFDKMRTFIRDAYERGGIITISWHLNNPLTGNTAWQPAPGTVQSILPGGDKHTLYTSWLDKIASFFLSLKGSHGEYIPVIFRPFHELNGDWFWWGGKNCTPEEIKELYRFTETYLRDQKKVHNLLYAYNTDRFKSIQAYLERYPGDEWVDITGFDIYQGYNIKENKAFMHELDTTLTILESIAREKNKIPALTEFGYNGLPDSTWWTNVLLNVLEKHAIAYALAWRNAGYRNEKQYEFYVPYPKQASAVNFVDFYRSPRTIFQKDINKEEVYH
ncbi:MAG: beta-mannosidase [Bacteroidetes bacterium]|nr:MAG: beta-mannosidase [Bacteroidota bacterium]